MKDFLITLENESGVICFEMPEIHISDLLSDLSYSREHIRVTIDIPGMKREE